MRKRWPAALTVVLVLTSCTHGDPDPKKLLQQADRLAWIHAWTRAAPLYAEAERLFQAEGDRRDALYAEVSNLRGRLPTLPVPQVSERLAEYLDEPLVARDPQLRLRLLMIKGETDTDLDPFLAAKSWKAASALATQLNEPAWANRARGELGLLAFLQGDINDAVIRLGEALKTAEATNDVPSQVRWLTIYGLGFVQLGKPSQALTFYDRALRLAAMMQGMDFPMMTYMGKGEALAKLGRFSQAERVLGEALGHAEARGALGYQAELTMSLAQMAYQQHRPDQAVALFGTAQNLARRAGSGAILSEIALSLGRIQLSEGRTREAEATVSEGVNAARAMQERMLLPKLLAQRADVKVTEKRYDAGRALLLEADDVLEGLLAHVSSPWVEGELIGAMNEVFAARIRLEGSQHQNPERLFDIVEEARGRSLWDLLALRPAADLTPSPALHAFERKISSLQAQLFRPETAAARKHLLDEIFLTEQQMAPASTERLVRTRMFGRGRKPVRLETVRRALRRDEVFVEFALAEPHSYAIVVTPSAARIRDLPGRNEIDSVARVLLRQIQSGAQSTPAARTLGAKIIAPIPELAEQRRMIISPDGLLNQVPFGLLASTSGRPLLQAHVISYVPSGSILTLLRSRVAGRAPRMALAVSASSPRSSRPKTSSATAAPTLSVSRGIYDLNGSALAPLAWAGDEARSVATILHGPGTTLLVGRSATENNFKNLPLSEYRVLHFAVHGIMSAKFPDRSALLLNPGGEDDGLLQAREILGLHLNADLVTLSACETGNGPTFGEDGVDSLVRPFFVAGARAVVANLWDADDAFSLALMKAFYGHLAAGDDEGEALRRAKLDMLHAFGPEAVPRLWSGLLLYGDGTQRVIQSKHVSQ